ncbi:hypothetical protein JQ543_14005 [Bradyrhizobium diazoefficiens]|nr:hypothetical protein [Bradyrhizobium diazoefficiens]MBR0848862.1 hypothetical protein [Bradyrhizobium diazoefficiens]
MSLFDYPRINFKGTIQLNPGTANNDDYAQQPGAALIPASFGPPYAGQALGLIDSKAVEARTFGMSDAAFIAWVQKTQTFDVSGSPGQTTNVIPAEWNYYGGMESTIDHAAAPETQASIIGIQTGPGHIYTDVSPGVPSSAVIGAALNYSGNITDVNPEGSPPATQFFIHGLTLRNNTTTFLSGAASKGACQWLNFYRNVNLTADGGAGGYVYHVMRKSDPGTTIQLPGFDDPRIVGVICRYYLYRRAGGASANAAIEKLYEEQRNNPATLEIVGTFAPLLAGETIFTGPVGRLLISNVTNIPAPAGTRNNGNGFVALAPAVLQYKGHTISADFSGTFPDYFQAPSNPKYDFGPVTLMVSNATDSAPVGPVDYANTDSGDRRGWIFDFDIASNTAAQRILQDPSAKFSLHHAQYGTVLAETDYYFVSNQQGIYAEQNGPADSFLNQGTSEPAKIAVYHRGRELSAAECPAITVWQYRSVPIQSPGNVEAIATRFKPGQSLHIDTSQPGNFLLTFSIDDAANPCITGFPPKSYNTFMLPPFITNAPSISLRILPNGVDFSRYYVDPHAAAPVGNDQLTFDVVYQNVLRTYYLLYPIMNLVFPLNSEPDVAKHAKAILGLTDPKQWMSGGYMPRTRDMSASRRTLLQAWCRKVLAGSAVA